ncbi:MFS transporter [Carnobacterium sp. CS13]|uniref:MFS transporter n=1 Tax=Carnobacterium sp. CS13 TaxID=2800128 RepID=UPI0019127D66|nr:MFS transporter [Carnobacterium sp. CS13]QQP70169.1 MFS transporter [Carnobacterium sp. CS13]
MSIKKKQTSLLLTIIVLFWFAQYVYIPYQTPYLNSIHLSSNAIGIIIGAYGISQMLLRLPIGILADKKGKHTLLIFIGALSSGLASLFRMFLPNGIGFLIGNLFSGLASAMWISFMVLFMSYYSYNEQQKATGKLIFANNLGMLGGFVMSTLLYDRVGMVVICLFSVIAGFVGAFLALFLKRPNRQNRTSYSTIDLLDVCKNNKLLLFSLLALIQQGIQMSTTMSFTTQIVRDLGASNLAVGLTSIVYMMAAVLSAVIGSKPNFYKRFTFDRSIPTVFLLLFLYCLFIPLTNSVFMICLLQILPGLSTGILFSSLTTEAMTEVPDDKKSTAMGFFQAVYAIGMSTFPLISGYINTHFSIQAAFLFLGCTSIVGVVASKWYYKRKKIGEYA